MVIRLFVGVVCALLTATASGAWRVDGETSSLKFATVKNSVVAELHHFTDISGEVSEGGGDTRGVGQR